MNSLRGNARGGARGSVRGNTRGSLRGGVRGNARSSQVNMYNDMNEGNSDYDRGVTMHTLDPLTSTTYQSNNTSSANAATSISNDASTASNHMMGSLRNNVYSNSNTSGGSPNGSGLSTDKSSNFSQYKDGFLDNTEASQMKNKNFNKRVGKNLKVNGINLGGVANNPVNANKNAKGYRNRLNPFSKTSMKHGQINQNPGWDDRVNVGTIGGDDREEEKEVDNHEVQQRQGSSLYGRNNQLSHIAQQNVQNQYGIRSEFYHSNDNAENEEGGNMSAPNEDFYGDTLGDGFHDDAQERRNQGVHKPHSRNLYESRKLGKNNLFVNVGIDGEDNDVVNHLGDARDLDAGEPNRANNNPLLSLSSGEEMENMNNQNMVIDKVHQNSNIHMTRNDKNNGTMNYTNVGKKRKNVKFDNSTFQKQKQKKNYYKTFNDSLKRYNNNSLKIMNAGIKKGGNSSFYGIPEDEKGLLDINIRVNTLADQVQSHGNDGDVMDTENKSNISPNNTAPNNSAPSATAGGTKTVSRNNHFSNFYPSMKKKPFNNMTFSLNKYLNSYVNFDRIKNKRMNNEKVINKRSSTVTAAMGARNDADMCDSTLVNPGQNFDDRNTSDQNGNESFTTYKAGSSEFAQMGNPNGGNLSELNALAKNLNLELLKNLRNSLQNEMSRNGGNKDNSKVKSNCPSYIECLSEVSEISDEEGGDESDKERDDSAQLGRDKNTFTQWTNNMAEAESARGMGEANGTSASHAANRGVTHGYALNQGPYGKTDLIQSLYSLYNNDKGADANSNVKEEISAEQPGGKSFQGGVESSDNYHHYGDNHSVEQTESTTGKKGTSFGSPNNVEMNELGEENEEEEEETEPFEQMRNEDLFINSYMPYPPEKYSSMYELHEIKILSPHILKTKFQKDGKSSYHSSLKDGKLILLLDLDNTLLQATSFAKFNMELPLENFVDENGEPELYKFFLPYYNFFYYLKFRPYVRQFLQILSLYYELSIYTNATREYADVVIAILDPDRTLFADRIVARCNSADREENKNFSKIYPNVDSKYVIAFDDRKDVWTDIPHSNILKAEHYNFFELSKYDIISHFKEPSTCKKRFVDMDMHLHFMTKVLLKLHKHFFERPLEVNVGKLMDEIMLSTLSNVGVYFTGFRKNSKNSQHVLSSDCEDRQKEIALELGAKIYTNYDMPGVTHIIAAKNCTDNLIKSKNANYNHIQKVHTLWLYHCRGTLQSGDSAFFDADELCKIYNNKPPLHPKKDHWFFGNKDEMRKQDDNSECIKIENLKSRIFLGTGEYTNDAVICSPLEQINIKWIEKEVKLRQIYDTPGGATSSSPVGATTDAQQRDKDAMRERTPHSEMSPLGEHMDEDDNFTYENGNVEEEEDEEEEEIEEAQGEDINLGTS
ncbi:NLI interacting factor-like phosphatase, putative [Plasmodium knowlesi strain H]|uniref:protein-serine/threonine phosphatase n=3 Tax=Plasmodium knowlesi TaxID=5850 RepID=A0A5K1VFI2_PLAKH|nr:NLI interacting factor-like phosphatase, putative [Plasmodium knowlesi strain H]OTN64616.1 putative NLI interacting factor-like phosphatase [Plasmodium knowlesi]CAA9988987.1 NLI interacting factor-like phosphatase, putative [Plasmodium knowlesi strain H]SBO24831.1 NLI interacting factor-like phosphatase, putative [Plasmodium knowlesi strain H]SBO28094.1 NLI interacting factor-like phosphatase, putative [Plasmodium knowlesi strain H]VVS78461.1 NLI interacting factor-like phosphatase, putativ|eukprot:XP_002261335.1 hypothetical protein, conserved in Plasmodium species [Plasmodium knowlesi strain H]